MRVPKRKYTLSNEGVQKLMGILDNMKESIYEENKAENGSGGLTEATISADFLNKLIRVSSLEEVVKNNERLSSVYAGYLSMYGFSNMVDMYIYAMSCDSVITLAKSKDYSNLVPVKRTIVRNGKEVEVTVYENPNKDNDDNEESNDNNKDKKRNRKGKPSKSSGKKVATSVVNVKNNSQEAVNLKNAASKFSVGKLSDSDNYTYMLAIRDEKGNVVGVIGFVEEGKYIKMQGYKHNGEIPGIAARGLVYLMSFAADKSKGVKMDKTDDPKAIVFFQKSGLEKQQDGSWVIEPEKLRNLLGRKG